MLAVIQMCGGWVYSSRNMNAKTIADAFKEWNEVLPGPVFVTGSSAIFLHLERSGGDTGGLLPKDIDLIMVTRVPMPLKSPSPDWTTDATRTDTSSGVTYRKDGSPDVDVIQAPVGKTSLNNLKEYEIHGVKVMLASISMLISAYKDACDDPERKDKNDAGKLNMLMDLPITPKADEDEMLKRKRRRCDIPSMPNFD